MKNNKYFKCNRNFILISAMALSLTFVACHSKVYNEAMSSARSFERAIDNASSIDELPYYSIFDYNPFDYLEGDEERAVVERMNQLNKKFNTKFEELSLLPGTYLLTIDDNLKVLDGDPSHIGEKYKLELSYKSGEKIAKLYSSNGNEYRTGTWKCENEPSERLDGFSISFDGRPDTWDLDRSGRLEFDIIWLDMPTKWIGNYYISPHSVYSANGTFVKSN